ncbi:MAG: hypothetical protein AAB511_01415 [Patescibacteria group bacterium]
MKTKLNKQRVVVKVGTGILFNSSGAPRAEAFESIAGQVAWCQKNGSEVIVVTSGAVAAARYLLTLSGKDSSRFTKQELAGIGASYLLSMWNKAFAPRDINTAQILLTYHNLFNTGERASIHRAIEAYCANGIIPLINENDVVSATEILSMEKGGSDNDWLASMVALLSLPGAVLFLSEIGGIFEKNAATGELQSRYAEIHAQNVPPFLLTASEASGNGRGGMRSKIRAAIRCHKRGMRVSVAGLHKHTITDFVSGTHVGTMFGTVTRLG